MKNLSESYMHSPVNIENTGPKVVTLVQVDDYLFEHIKVNFSSGRVTLVINCLSKNIFFKLIMSRIWKIIFFHYVDVFNSK